MRKGSVRLDPKMPCDVIVYFKLRHKTMTSPVVKFSSLTEPIAKKIPVSLLLETNCGKMLYAKKICETLEQ